MDITTIQKVMAPHLSNFRDREGYFEDDKRRIQYFRHNPANVDAQEIVLKISAMDHTEVDDLIQSRQIVADHIASLNIDNDLQKGSPQIVNTIARVNVGVKTINLYAFATRYCNWHNMEVYPIYDKTMEDILELYMERIRNHKIVKEEIFHYPRYQEMMVDFRNSLALTNFNFKEIDKIIWIHGNKILQELTKYL